MLLTCGVRMFDDVTSFVLKSIYKLKMTYIVGGTKLYALSSNRCYLTVANTVSCMDSIHSRTSHFRAGKKKGSHIKQRELLCRDQQDVYSNVRLRCVDERISKLKRKPQHNHRTTASANIYYPPANQEQT